MFLLHILQKYSMIPIRTKKHFHSPDHQPHSICHAIHNKGMGQNTRERGVTESKRSKHREDLQRILWGLRIPKKCSKFVRITTWHLDWIFQKLRSLLSKLPACNVRVRVCSVCVCTVCVCRCVHELRGISEVSDNSMHTRHCLLLYNWAFQRQYGTKASCPSVFLNFRP